MQAKHEKVAGTIEVLTEEDSDTITMLPTTKCCCDSSSQDFEHIVFGEKLSDLEIKFAQHILKEQFPHIQGL